MSERTAILTPIGRLVQGSLYDEVKTDAENKPLTYKSGPKTGQARVEFFFALAIAKNGEKHWSETPWGALIYKVGHTEFPNGQANAPTFAWKIVDGDSTIPNQNGVRPCDAEGHAGHWVLKFKSGFAPNIYNADGTQQLLEKNYVNLGDYIQVYGFVSGNDSKQQPGVYLNHSMVAFAGYGKRIILTPDAKSVGFGNSPIPTGLSPTPLSQGFSPGPVESSPITPYPEILMPPVPPQPVPRDRVMTPKAGTLSYEQYIAAGWTDELLIQNGFMMP